MSLTPKDAVAAAGRLLGVDVRGKSIIQGPASAVFDDSHGRRSIHPTLAISRSEARRRRSRTASQNNRRTQLEVVMESLQMGARDSQHLSMSKSMPNFSPPRKASHKTKDGSVVSKEEMKSDEIPRRKITIEGIDMAKAKKTTRRITAGRKPQRSFHQSRDGNAPSQQWKWKRTQGHGTSTAIISDSKFTKSLYASQLQRDRAPETQRFELLERALFQKSGLAHPNFYRGAHKLSATKMNASRAAGHAGKSNPKAKPRGLPKHYGDSVLQGRHSYVNCSIKNGCIYYDHPSNHVAPPQFSDIMAASDFNKPGYNVMDLMIPPNGRTHPLARARRAATGRQQSGKTQEVYFDLEDSAEVKREGNQHERIDHETSVEKERMPPENQQFNHGPKDALSEPGSSVLRLEHLTSGLNGEEELVSIDHQECAIETEINTLDMRLEKIRQQKAQRVKAGEAYNNASAEDAPSDTDISPLSDLKTAPGDNGAASDCQAQGAKDTVSSDVPAQVSMQISEGRDDGNSTEPVSSQSRIVDDEGKGDADVLFQAVDLSMAMPAQWSTFIDHAWATKSTSDDPSNSEQQLVLQAAGEQTARGGRELRLNLFTSGKYHIGEGGSKQDAGHESVE